MYSLNYKVTTSTCDSEGKFKLFSALQMMQDCYHGSGVKNLKKCSLDNAILPLYI